jgi:ABC-type nickel/cobalt efflux system permease component RcnA
MIAALTGLVAGMTHVVLGPDHLTAVAPLAVRQQKRAWVPGIRWGVGHSAGVAVVGLLTLWLRDKIPVELISSWGERLVGVLLLAIGFWALRKALKQNIHTHEHEHDGEKHLHVHVHGHAHRHDESHHKPGSHMHTHAAFGIGTLHGLAGSSHFLGVLPALAFRTQMEAITYLLAFGVGTVAAMGLFSWGLGFVAVKCSSRSINAYRGLMATCAVVAIGVGCFWLAASFSGHAPHTH